MSDRTPTNIEVTPLDFTSIEDEATEAFNADPAKWRIELDDGQTIKAKIAFQPWGIVNTPEGTFCLCNEGVGDDDPIGDDGLTIEVHYEIHDAEGKTKSFGLLPVASCKLDLSDVQEKATGEPVNLADFIRSFGSRLEANYSSWRKRLSDAMAVEA